MHILLVADGRSPITRNWVQGLLMLGYQVSLISTFPCAPIENVNLASILPVALSTLAGTQAGSSDIAQTQNRGRTYLSQLRPWLQKVRYILGPLSLPFFTGKYKRLVNEIKPDLVHALRIPFEGMLAAATPCEYQLVISTWGNDLTLHAQASSLMKSWTHKALSRANALMADTQRDLHLALEWGLNQQAPKLEVPGNGGIDLQGMEALRFAKRLKPEFLVSDGPFLINPRGFRPGSVHQDVFFKAIPLIVKEFPNTRFLCPAMQSQPEAMGWVKKLGIGAYMILLPYLSQNALWDLFLRSQIYLSISSHDGTPNTLLEAMTCGCFPIAGDIESLREWIMPGENGLLVNPSSPKDIADAAIRALKDDKLREKARVINKNIIRERVDSHIVRERIGNFYQTILKLNN